MSLEAPKTARVTPHYKKKTMVNVLSFYYVSSVLSVVNKLYEKRV